MTDDEFSLRSELDLYYKTVESLRNELTIAQEDRDTYKDWALWYKGMFYKTLEGQKYKQQREEIMND
jgi:hypothetical protein